MSSNPFFYQAIAGPSRPPPVSVADVAAPDSASRTFFVQRPTQWTLHGMAPNLPSAGGHRPTNSPCHDVGPVGSPSSPRPEAPRRSSSLSTLVNAWEPNDTKGMYDDTMIWFGEEEVLELKTPKLESLQIHSFTHSKVKAFECETCSQSFSVQSNLRRHEKLHTRAGSVELEPV
ncbi:hypothetical protein RQP46_008551 [Phenoliferia psychrophenolica]